MRLRERLAQAKQKRTIRKAEQLQKRSEQLAYKLYLHRLSSKKAGDQASDWAKAQEIVRNPSRRALYRTNYLPRKVRASIPWKWSISGLAGKKSWEWLELLIVPLFLAMGAFYLENRVESRQENMAAQRYEQESKIATERYEQESKIADERAKQEILDGYFKQMQELLLDRGLRESSEDSEVRSVARAITATTMKELNGNRNAILINFLQEADLIRPGSDLIETADSENTQKPEGIALLSGLNLSQTHLFRANLFRAHLNKTNLTDAYLPGANLRQADLTDAYLPGANLRQADLSNAYLPGTNLRDADLYYANLRNADLYNADLYNANLLGTNLRNADLRNADLRDTYLINVDLLGSNLSGANLQGVGLKESAILDSYLCETKLPEDFNVDPNRDCP